VQSFPGLGDDYSATCFARASCSTGASGRPLERFQYADDGEAPDGSKPGAVYYGDLQHIDKSNNEIKIIGDGPARLPLRQGRPAKFAEHGYRRKARPGTVGGPGLQAG